MQQFIKGDVLYKHLEDFYENNIFTAPLGIKLTNANVGNIAVEINIKEEHNNSHGITHGGVVMSLCDMAMAGCCISVNSKVVTLDFNINFIKALYEGQKAHAMSYILHSGKSSIVVEAEIYNEKQQLCAKARGTFYVVGKIIE